MKYFLSILFIAAYCLQLTAQNDLFYDPGFRQPECSNCPNGVLNYQYDTGTKAGIGFGLVKEITPKVDLTTTIGYQFWRYQVSDNRYPSDYPLEPFKENNHLINLSLGQRFHFVQFETASIYTGTQFNFQTFLRGNNLNFGLTIEPSIGWRKSIGEKSEFYMSMSYDQLLTTYGQVTKQRPGKVGINMGFNIILKKKTEVAATDE